MDAICAAPRKRGAILGVDNTFATPLNQRPLELGADAVVHSVTKFIGGHSDLLGGVVTVRDASLLAALRQARELAGATPGTLEAFLAVRGARTLALRLERAQHNAMTVAERLARHPNVTLTRYPGLMSHPTHEAARRQLKGFGTIISFDVRGDALAADAVCGRLQLIQHATSLGAVESTIERRASISGQEHLPATLLVQGARHILGPFGVDCDLRRWGLKLAERGGRSGKKRAIVAVARKLAVLLHHLWVSGEVYEPFHHRKPNALAIAA